MPYRRIEAGEVDAGGDASDALRWDVELRGKPVGDFLAGGDEAIRQRAEGEAAPKAVGVIDFDMARADKNFPRELRGETGEPAVVGAVRVDDFDPMSIEPKRQSGDFKRQEDLAAVEGKVGDPGLACALGNFTLGRSSERNPVALRAHPLELGEDAYFLPAPAERRFGV